MVNEHCVQPQESAPMNEKSLYRAVAEARQMMADGVSWRAAVRSAAAAHGVDAGDVAWYSANAQAGVREAWRALYGDTGTAAKQQDRAPLQTEHEHDMRPRYRATA
jgi:hypothetical protein